MRLLSAADIEAAWPPRKAIDTMADALRAISGGDAIHLERRSLPLPGITGLLMGAAQPGLGQLAKLVSVAPGNPAHGLPGTLGTALLCDDRTGEPLALLDGTALTARRTAAVVACAIDTLAPRDARSVLLFGAGTQAAALVRALDALDRFDEIHVQARSPASVSAFIAQWQPGLRLRLVAVDDVERRLAESRIVVTATNSNTPLFPAHQLAPGTHLTAIGSFSAGMCEFDPALCRDASLFVESRDTALHEAGELVTARDRGWTSEHDWTELGEVLAGRRPGRADARQTTVFKSVGHVVFDLHAARAVYDRALAMGLGTSWKP